jgi:hypothetical protein
MIATQNAITVTPEFFVEKFEYFSVRPIIVPKTIVDINIPNIHVTLNILSSFVIFYTL